ncbi:hypothetical protein ACO0QE_004185 [Hanseniaspora vineae]
MCKIKLPPSVPLYIKRNHLVSIFNIANLSKSVNLQNQWIHPWKNLFLWPNALPIYHKIITNPMTTTTTTTTSNNTETQRFVDLLVSSKYNNCLTSLNLNGSKDWFIWGNFAKNIIAFEDNSSLSVKPEFKWSFGKNFTGGASSWKHLKGAEKLFKKYIHLSGRGVAVLQSETGSSIYSINLKDNKDEVMIRLDNLLGCSGSNYNELVANMSPYVFSSTPEKSASNETPTKKPEMEVNKTWKFLKFWKKPEAKTSKVSESTALEPVAANTQVNEFSAKEFVNISKSIFNKITSTVRYYYHQFANGNLSLGRGLLSANYVTIKGPRTILIQSNSIKSEILDRLMAPQKTTPKSLSKPVSPFDLNEAASKQSNVSQQLQESINNKNHLSYAYVDLQKDKVVFQSTPDFNASIKELMSKK